VINKIVQTMADALAGLKDGAVVLLGGFGSVGQPNQLLDGLMELGTKELTIVCNNAGSGRVGLAKLMDLGQVRKLVCSFPRSSDPVVFESLYRAGKIELEIVPQGTLAERIRAAGAGVGAFYTPTSMGTPIARGKEVREFNGREMVLEYALKGDVALVEAWQADRWGNLTFRDAARNFNPIMATAADCTIVQTQHLVELGELNPEHIVTPGIFVDRVLHIPYGDPPIF
jgi:3-oxoadipate CoA-transferase alpha subunit